MSLYAFGSNGSGQLGIGNSNDFNVPVLCQFPEAELGIPTKIVAGGNHTLVQLDNGMVYHSGLPPETPSLPAEAFQKTHFSALGEKTKLCSAWWSGSVYVGIDENIRTAGSGLKGERGTGESSNPNVLEKLQLLSQDKGLGSTEIIDVDSGVDHVVVVLADGTLWGWGNGRKGQLPGLQEITYTPHKLACSEQPVARAVCGRDFTFVMRRDGTNEVFGTRKWGLQDKALESIVGWKDVGASWGSVFVLTETGMIECWGRNDHGQLAPPGLPDIEQMAVGSEHVVALTKDGKVISWGWGEHGNCGADIDGNGDVKGRWNEIPVHTSDDVLGVGAGCATSFFWTAASSPQKG